MAADKTDDGNHGPRREEIRYNICGVLCGGQAQTYLQKFLLCQLLITACSSLPWSSIPLPLPSSSEFLNDASDDDFTCILDEQRADADLHAFWMSPFFCNVCVYPDCQHVTSNLHTQNTWSAISSVRSTAVKLLMLLFCLIPRGRLLGYRTQQLDHNTGRGNT
jgi:hypothetical protein